MQNSLFPHSELNREELANCSLVRRLPPPAPTCCGCPSPAALGAVCACAALCAAIMYDCSKMAPSVRHFAKSHLAQLGVCLLVRSSLAARMSGLCPSMLCRSSGLAVGVALRAYIRRLKSAANIPIKPREPPQRPPKGSKAIRIEDRNQEPLREPHRRSRHYQGIAERCIIARPLSAVKGQD